MIDRRLLAWVAAALLALALPGCTPEKARAVKTAATQFKVEAIAAINAIDAMHRRELASPPMSDTDAARAFAENVLDFDQPLIMPDEVDFLINPNAGLGSQAVEKSWTDALAALRRGYTAFADLFDRLDHGSLLARDAVSEALPHIERLTAQLANFAVSIDANPPRFVAYRGEYAAQINRIREEVKSNRRTAAEAFGPLANLREKWLQMEREEATLKRDVVEQCVKAATLGQGVRSLIRDYETLTLDDLNDLAARALAAAGAVTGKDYTALQQQGSQILAAIKADEVWNTAASTALEEIQNAVKARLPTVP